MNDLYIGRFAPSPTGPLHFGSLVSALASYLDARAANGRWLVRIEDIDPPREVPGAADIILRQLEQHGLEWDAPVLYQSHRADAYQAAINQLQQAGKIYGCNCSRQRLRQLGEAYDGRCRGANLAIGSSVALRLIIPTDIAIEYDDIFQGPQRNDLSLSAGDFIVRRRDQLTAYQLAVSVDDGYQGITDVIRGSDLLSSTPRQWFLMQQLRLRQPRYGHIPVALNRSGQKLSKQNHARQLTPGEARDTVFSALAWLRQSPPPGLRGAPLPELMSWAIRHWQRATVPPQMALLAPAENELDI